MASDCIGVQGATIFADTIDGSCLAETSEVFYAKLVFTRSSNDVKNGNRNTSPKGDEVS